MLSWSSKQFNYRETTPPIFPLKKIEVDAQLYPQPEFEGIGGVIPFASVKLRCIKYGEKFSVVDRVEIDDICGPVDTECVNTKRRCGFELWNEFVLLNSYAVGAPKKILTGFDECDLRQLRNKLLLDDAIFDLCEVKPVFHRPSSSNAENRFHMCQDFISSKPSQSDSKIDIKSEFLLSVSPPPRLVVPPSIDQLIIDEPYRTGRPPQLWCSAYPLHAFYRPLSTYTLVSVLLQTISPPRTSRKRLGDRADSGSGPVDAERLSSRPWLDAASICANLSSISQGLSWLLAVTIHTDYSCLRQAFPAHASSLLDKSSLLQTSSDQCGNDRVDSSLVDSRFCLSRPPHRSYFQTILTELLLSNVSGKCDSMALEVRAVPHKPLPEPLANSSTVHTLDRLLCAPGQLMYIPQLQTQPYVQIAYDVPVALQRHSTWRCGVPAASLLEEMYVRPLLAELRRADAGCLEMDRDGLRDSRRRSAAGRNIYEATPVQVFTTSPTRTAIAATAQEAMPKTGTVGAGAWIPFPVVCIERQQIPPDLIPPSEPTGAVDALPTEPLTSREDTHTPTATTVSCAYVAAAEEELSPPQEYALCDHRESPVATCHDCMEQQRSLLSPVQTSKMESMTSSLDAETVTVAMDQQNDGQESRGGPLKIEQHDYIPPCSPVHDPSDKLPLDMLSSDDGEDSTPPPQCPPNQAKAVTHRTHRESSSQLSVDEMVRAYLQVRCPVSLSHTTEKGGPQSRPLVHSLPDGTRKSARNGLDDEVCRSLDKGVSLTPRCSPRSLLGPSNSHKHTNTPEHLMSEEQLQHKGFEYESADDSCAVAGLRILVSEDLLVDKPLYATLLNQKYHIHCHDAPLAPPIAFVVDELTGVSILPEEVLVDRENLKIFLRQLTRNAYRYDTLWLVISHNNSSISSGTNSGTIHLHGDMAALGQCLSQFPCTVAVRQVEELAVADCLRAICVQAAAPHRRGNMIASWYKDRPALLRLSNPVFAAHCEFLQLFPSINFFLAIKILSRWRLSELPHIDERSLNDAFPVRCSGSLQRFVRVMHLAFHDRQSARGDQFA